MRDMNRIDPILARLRRVWMANPDMRLCQMVANVTTEDDIYHVEDEQLMDQIEAVHMPRSA